MHRTRSKMAARIGVTVILAPGQPEQAWYVAEAWEQLTAIGLTPGAPRDRLSLQAI
jgi:hypothetical protein